MKSINTAVIFSILCLLVACGGGGKTTVPKAQEAAETSVDIGTHVVHFSAQSTDQLPPAVARAYGIVRSKNRAMLNVSIIDSETDHSVTAQLTVKTRNLTGQLKNVVMRKITEQEAIYYIGETPVANRETLIFDISVKPDGIDKPAELRFKRQFYSD